MLVHIGYKDFFFQFPDYLYSVSVSISQAHWEKRTKPRSQLIVFASKKNSFLLFYFWLQEE